MACKKAALLLQRTSFLASESVQGLALSFEGVDCVYGYYRLSHGVVSVGDSIHDHRLQLVLEHLCQSVIFGSLTLSNTNQVILGGNLIFQKFELSLSCSTFSRELKISEIQDQNIRFTIAGKYLKMQRESTCKSSGKLLFAISR